MILLGGALGDRFGRRRVFVIGVAWFALASALCGLSPDIGVLIAARVLQGVGGALLVAGLLAIIQATFVPTDRPRAVGAWSGLGGVAGAIGPLLGGWIIVAAGWQWVFLLNLPLAVVVIAVTMRHVPETRDPSASGKFDITGAVLAALALAGITYALIEAPAPGSAGPVSAGVIGVAAAVAFVLVERHRGPSPGGTAPMLPLDVFASRQFTAVNVVTFLVYGAFGGVLFLLVLQLQVVSGLLAPGRGHRAAAGDDSHAAALAAGRIARAADRAPMADDRRHCHHRRRRAADAPHRPGRLVRGRCAAGHDRLRIRALDDRRSAHRDRAGQRGRPSRRRRQRREQRGGQGRGCSLSPGCPRPSAWAPLPTTRPTCSAAASRPA